MRNKVFFTTMRSKIALIILILLLSSNCRSRGSSIHFSDVTESLGLDVLVSAHGISLGDWNGDQCLDIFVPSHGRLPSHLFENNCQGKFIDRIEQFGTEVTYRLYRQGGSHEEKIFLSPFLAVENKFRLNHETFLFHPPAMSRRSQPSYYIWRDLNTMAWHVRWAGERGDFAGTITWSIPAKVKTYGFNNPDRIRTSAHSLDFSSTIDSGEEKGVDILRSSFIRSDVTITFDLRINGRHSRKDIYIGSIGAHPWDDRFSLGRFKPLWIRPSYQPGLDIGYFLWRTPEDGVWHFRWSNNSSERLFHGTIQTQSGKFAIIDSSPSEQLTLMELGKGISFNSKLRSGEAGVDFTVDNWQRQGFFEVSAYINNVPATVQAGAWSQFDGQKSSFVYGHDFGKQRFLIPSLTSATFFVTPRFIGWQGEDGGVSIYKGEIRTSREISNATFEPEIVNSTLKVKSNRLTFVAPFSRSLQKLRFIHEGIRAFGDRHAAVWGDLDNDGDTDLYISNGGNKGVGNIFGGELWENHKGMDFVNEGIRKGVNDPNGRGKGVSLVDYDNDGQLDIYKANKGRPCRLFHNRQGSFEDTAEQLGVAGPFGVYPAISANWADADRDGYMDLLLTSNPIRLFKNVNGSFFQDVTEEAGLGNQHMVHSVSWGDYNNDGHLDLYLSKSYGISKFKSSKNVLLRNSGDGTFTDVTSVSRVGSNHNSRDATWFDFDNDGDVDLYVVNSTSILSFAPWFFRPLLGLWLKLLEWNVFDHSNILYENLSDGTFRNVTHQAKVGGSGANSGVAVGDFNRDGFVDLFLSSGYYPLETGKLLVYKNLPNKNHWITLRLIGRQSNRDAIGAKVSLYTDSRLQFREVNGGVHGFSQDWPIIHFGVGKSNTINRLEVTWPSGNKTRLENLKVDQMLTITE